MVHSIAVVAGARPNFMKIAPVLRALDCNPECETTLIHTGQHYDANLSDVFFDELRIRKPDVSLQCHGTTHGEQTGRILEQIEAVFLERSGTISAFATVVVVGDVNSTLAAALAAAKLGISVAHIEAGLRSFDRSMPEETNRILTDSISDVLLVSDPAAINNLRAEGHPSDKIHLVGNVMIDTLLDNLQVAKQRPTLQKFGLKPRGYGTVTLHRPSNVDNTDVLSKLVNVLIDGSEKLPLIFPMHPRTENRLKHSGLLAQLVAASGIHVSPPLGYLDLLCLNASARVIITDSGGLQEESTALGIPCLTVRSNTERPITVSEGTSTLIGNAPMLLAKGIQDVLDGTYKQGACPKLWDGRAAERIAQILAPGPSTA